MGCLGDSSIFRYVTGELAASARKRVEEELGNCRHCAALAAELMRASAIRDPDRRLGDAESGRSAPADEADFDRPAGEGGDASEPRRRYILGPIIARGGMGTIVAAFDRRLNRSVAVKRMDRQTPVLVSRFEREIRVTALLQHPGIVPIYDAGVLPDGRLFYAMRHVAGGSLAQAMQACEHARDRLALLGCLIAVADAVAYAHERGVIHRDLKPANIMVGAFGETIVIDWGLASVDDPSVHELAARGSEHGSDPATTRHGVVIGTPRYMAPEQARGELATRQSDVYALGAILYHVLAGVPAVIGDESDAVLDRAARADVRPLRELAPRLPDDLIAIVERAMAMAPAARYASAGELAADLRRFHTGQLVGAHRYSRRALLWRTVRRHRAAFTLAALLAVVVIGGGTLSVRSVVHEGEHAQREWDRAEHERAGAEDLVQFLLEDQRTKLTALGRLDIMAGVADRVESYYLTTARGRADLPDALRERAELDGLRAAIADEAGDGANADRYLEHGLALIDRLSPVADASDTRAELLGYTAMRVAQKGNFERARAVALEAVALDRQSAMRGTPEQQRRRQLKIARLLNWAATQADRLGRPADADRERNEATEILERGMTEDPTSPDLAKQLAQVKAKTGQGLMLRGRLDDAERALRAALATEDRLPVRERYDAEVQYLTAYTYLALADVRHGKGDADGARQFNERAIATASAIQALEPASINWQMVQARAEANLGSIELERSGWAAAATHLTAARAVNEQLVARDPSSRDHRRAAAVATAELAEAETGLHRFDAAREAWRAALAHLEVLAQSNTANSRLELAYGLRGYAKFEREHEHVAAAVEALQRAVDIMEHTPSGTDRPVMTYYRAEIFAEQATEQAQRGQHRDALAAWQRAGELLRAVAEHVPLEPDWAKLLAAADAHLGPRAARHTATGGPR